MVGTEEGFSLIRLDSQSPYRSPFTLQIRKVYMTGQRDRLFMAGVIHMMIVR